MLVLTLFLCISVIYTFRFTPFERFLKLGNFLMKREEKKENRKKRGKKREKGKNDDKILYFSGNKDIFRTHYV